MFADVPGGAYVLSLIAANEAGISPQSNPLTMLVSEDCSGLPHGPTDVRSWTIGTTVLVSWSPPVVGAAATGYTVSASGAYEGSFATARRTLSSPAAPGSYILRVAATNPCGAGPSAPAITIDVR